MTRPAHVAETAPVLLVGTAITCLGALDGGYAPTAWGWSALVGLWSAVLVLALRRRIAFTRAGSGLLVALLGFVGWKASGLLWTASVPRTMLELERDLVYVGTVAALLLISRPAWRQPLLGGVVAGVVAVTAYGLGEYFLATPGPDATQGYLLHRPVGYANAMGALAALALPLVLAGAAHATGAALRSLAGAAVVPLTVALYLSQSRIAWVALAVGLVVWFARTRAARGTAALVLLPAGLAVAVVSGLDLLDARALAGDREGRALAAAAVVLLVTIGAGWLVPATGRMRMRWRWPRVVRAALLAVITLTAAAAVAISGLGDRGHYWRVAWTMAERQPVGGAGAGTFEPHWFELREIERSVRDAHSLYLETLAELGTVGLVLLLIVLALPIVAVRARRDPLEIALLAGYSTYLVHAGFDWDWELPVVTVAALVLATLLVLPREGETTIVLSPGARLAGGAGALALVVFALVGLVGNSFVAAAERQAVAGDHVAATATAARAARFAPWTSQPWLVAASSFTRLGQPDAARAASLEGLERDEREWRLWYGLGLVSSGEARQRALLRAGELNPFLLGRAPSGSGRSR